MQKYRQLIQYARRQRGVFVLILALTLAASALVALQPWPMKLLVDHLLGKQPLPGALQSTFGLLGSRHTPTALLLVITLGILGLFGLNTVLEITLAYFWTAAGRRMVYDLAEDLFARLQRRSVLFHSRSTVGDTMSRITVDSWSVYQVLDALCFAPLHALLAMVGMVFLMWQLDVMLTLLALAIAPFMVGASFLVGKPLRAAAKLRREIESRIQSHIQQTLTGIPVVQAFVQEERQHARLEQFANAAIRAQQRSVLVGSVNSLSSGLITTLGTGLILWVGARHVIEVLGAAPEVAEKPGAIQLPPARGEVQIENVTFGYEPGQPVLRGVSLAAYPGRILAIVGATGAGKSTLGHLVPRFFDPWQGRVLVDGHDVRDLRLKSLR